MTATFSSEAHRDALCRRLIELAKDMQRSFDQGSPPLIAVSDEMIGDILTAAACVRAAKANGELAGKES